MTRTLPLTSSSMLKSHGALYRCSKFVESYLDLVFAAITQTFPRQLSPLAPVADRPPFMSPSLYRNKLDFPCATLVQFLALRALVSPVYAYTTDQSYGSISSMRSSHDGLSDGERLKHHLPLNKPHQRLGSEQPSFLSQSSSPYFLTKYRLGPTRREDNTPSSIPDGNLPDVKYNGIIRVLDIKTSEFLVPWIHATKLRIFSLTTSSTQLVAACAQYHPSVPYGAMCSSGYYGPYTPYTPGREYLLPGKDWCVFFFSRTRSLFPSLVSFADGYGSSAASSPPIRTPYSGYAPAPYGELAVVLIFGFAYIHPESSTLATNPVTLIYYTDTNSKAFLYGVGNLDAFKASTKFTGISRLVSLHIEDVFIHTTIRVT
ncbi:hypothetical protein DL96DRAFT_1821721 [Flagelloscypha sp. PMI_526]|nr:hypothetical protein DL96DRAFT_1821721 [Flagelloscypha sp. PMI_526]